LYPDSLLMRTENNETPIDVAGSFGQRQLSYKLREEKETRFDSNHNKVSPFSDRYKETNNNEVSLDVMGSSGTKQFFNKRIRNELSRKDSEDSLSVNALLSEYCYEKSENAPEETNDRVGNQCSVEGGVHVTYKNNSHDVVSPLSKTDERHEKYPKQSSSIVHTLQGIHIPIPQNKHVERRALPCNGVRGSIGSCNDVTKENGTSPSYVGSQITNTGASTLAIAPDASRNNNCKLKLMGDLLHNLEEAEKFWDVQSLPTQSILHRVMAIEREVFREVKDGGVKNRILALFYVDGPSKGTWAEWVNGIEYILLNGKQKGSIFERIEYLEWLVEGELKTGNIRERLLSLNKMQTEVSSCGNNKGYTHDRNQDNSNKSSVSITNQGKLSLMDGLLKNLEGVEAMWDVLPLGTKSVVHRISTIENIVFHAVKEGGLKSRLLALFYVDGTNHGTWDEWIDGIELLLQNERQQGSIVERIKIVESLVEGEIKSGNYYDRLLSLNGMSTQHL